MDWKTIAKKLSLIPCYQDGQLWWTGHLGGQTHLLRLVGPLDARRVEALRIEADFDFTLVLHAEAYVEPTTPIPQPDHFAGLPGAPILHGNAAFVGLTAESASSLHALHAQFGLTISPGRLDIAAAGCSELTSPTAILDAVTRLTALVAALTDPDKSQRIAEVEGWLAGC